MPLASRRQKDIIFCHTLLQIRGELKDSIQPKYSKSKRYLVLFNGQIYNTKYLNTLVKPENNDLDTNYILELIEKYGIDGINYIDGMFALVVYDFKQNNLFLLEILQVKKIYITILIVKMSL